MTWCYAKGMAKMTDICPSSFLGIPPGALIHPKVKCGFCGRIFTTRSLKNKQLPKHNVLN